MEQTNSFTLQQIKQVTPDVKTYIFKPVDPSFTWSAGQYLDWQLPHPNADDRGERRWFSVASALNEGEVWLSCRFAEDGSTLKKTIQDLKIGDTVEAKGPFGEFTLEDTDQPVVLIAGGIGITPFRSIINDLAAKGLLKNLTLIHGNRSQDNIPFGEELATMAAQHDGFTYHQTFSPTIIDADLVKELCGPLGDKTYMISGLEKMVESIKESLVHAGVAADAIRIDDFGGYDYHLDKPIY